MAHQTERDSEDELRRQEQIQTEDLIDFFLTKERAETDFNLLDERKEYDRAAQSAIEEINNQTNMTKLTKLQLASRDQFLAVVSHDLRSPLGSISMAAETMKQDLKSGDTINQIKMIDVIERIVEKKGLTLVIEECTEEIKVRADPDRILQVLSNLIGNSLKFTPKGGEIKVSIKNHPFQVSVIDTGCGISSNDQSALFNKFTQLTSTDRSGLGLGLFICKWIIEAHHGKITVSSELNKGSEFTFTLGE